MSEQPNSEIEDEKIVEQEDINTVIENDKPVVLEEVSKEVITNKPEEILLRLGDIILISNPSNEILNDNIFLKDEIKIKYPNFFYTFSNTVYQWNEIGRAHV